MVCVELELFTSTNRNDFELMKAIILAAGKGSRLYPITLNKPKGLLKIGNETILDRLIRQFKEAGVSDIVIVIGYQKEKIREHFDDSVRFIEYDDYDKTNNLHTLWSSKNELNGDVVVSFADLVLHDDVIGKFLSSKGDIVMTVDTSQVLDGTMRVEIDSERVLSIKTTNTVDASGNFIGLSKFNDFGCKILINEMSEIINKNYDDYYTLAIDNMARRGVIVNYCDISGILWREIDTKDEYNEVLSIGLDFNKNT
jgi:L-glutamine-phosphate cytidylyltransferase